MEEEKLLGISLSISPESGDIHLTSFRWKAEKGPYISISHAVIYSYIYVYIHIYVYIYTYTPCYLVVKEERQFCKTCTCGGLIAIVIFLSLPFMPNTVDLNEEKSLKTSLSFKSNQVNDDVRFYRND